MPSSSLLSRRRFAWNDVRGRDAQRVEHVGHGEAPPLDARGAVEGLGGVALDERLHEERPAEELVLRAARVEEEGLRHLRGDVEALVLHRRLRREHEQLRRPEVRAAREQVALLARELELLVGLDEDVRGLLQRLLARRRIHAHGALRERHGLPEGAPQVVVHGCRPTQRRRRAHSLGCFSAWPWAAYDFV